LVAVMTRAARVVFGLMLMIVTAPLCAAEPLTVFTVNYPLQYFAQRIAGEHAKVIFPVPDDVDPAFWVPDRQTVLAYQGADLIMRNGAGYAGWVDKVSLPRLRLVDTSVSFRQDLIDVQDTVTHSHGGEAAHSHSGRAFTTWLDFELAVMQARTMTEAMSRKRPEHRQDFETNFERLRQDLRALDDALSQVLSGLQPPRLFASHPVYQYLARRYQVAVQSMVWEPGILPAEQQWQSLRGFQANFSAELMLWEKPALPQTMQRLRAMGIESVVFDPCANRPDGGDFLDVMRANIANLERVVRTGTAP
jgi:zinc transport system substrate-binding protein